MNHKIMSKLGHLINGDTTSLNDGIIGGVEGRAMRSRDYLREEWGEKVVFSCDVDHMYASANDMQSKDREMIQLKELILVHLELIQRNSEILLSKDKEIAVLKQERDTLRQRCERMERRVTLHRQREDIVTSTSIPPVVLTDIPCTSALSVPPAPMSPICSASQSNAGKRRRISASCVSSRKRRRSGCSTDLRKRSCSASDSNEVERRMRLRPLLTTDTAYFTTAGDEKDVWTPADLRVAPEAQSQGEEVVQVPSWREKVLSPLYVIEGTENLEDEVFTKRHQKHESDERRRKRWDIQRIREQNHLEKLKQRELKGRGKNSSESSAPTENQVSSFFPAPDDVQEISVDCNLPVVAFGLPLRDFGSAEFSLSWKKSHSTLSRQQR